MAQLNTRYRKPQLPPQGGTAPQAFEPSNTMRTHEGAPAAKISPEMALRRSVCSCLLFENEHYEDGQAIADRIKDLVGQVSTKAVIDLAYDARSHFNLRHVPLLLLAAVAAPGRGGSREIGDALAATIQRPDELSEFVAIYAKVWGVAPNAVKKRLSAQVKKGLAAAFNKFDQFQLARYFSQSGEKDAIVRGRDVLFLAHPKPADETKAALFKRIAAKEAIAEGGADSWEVNLSKGADKKETFERQLRDGKIGYLAILRNIRGMIEAKVDPALIEAGILARRGARRVLPFRYVAAARACPQMTPALDRALQAAIADAPKLPGKTIVLVDVSGSMNEKLSAKSDLSRMDAAAALAALISGDDIRVFTLSQQLVEVKCERGLSGIDAVIRSQLHGGTYLGQSIRALHAVPADRLIVLTDEQSHDHVGGPRVRFGYMVNVASAKYGVGYGEPWIHLDGFSETILRWIGEYEQLGRKAA